MIVIFDLDGTILDTFSLLEASVKHSFSKHLCDKTLTHDDIKSFFGPPLTQSFYKWCKSEEKTQQMIDTYRMFSNKHMQEYVRVFPHIKRLLTMLKDNHYSLVILSNKIRQAVVEQLSYTDLLDFFDMIIGGDDVDKAKPDPEGIMRIKEQFKDDAIMIGDSIYDIQAAKNAQVQSIAVCWGVVSKETFENEKPDKIIEDPKQLLNAIKELETYV